MKKIFLFLLVLFINVSVFSQNDMSDKAKKENMGQTIKEVNTSYRDQLKAIKADPNLTKEQKKQKRRELKEMKRTRIHEIKDGAANRKNEGKAARKEKKVKENKGKNK